MDLTISVKKPNYYEDEESYSYGSSISMKAIDPDIQRRYFEHYQITKMSTLNKHQYCMQMIQKYQDQLSQIPKSPSQGKQEKTTQVEEEKEEGYEMVEEPIEQEYLEPIGGDTLPPP